MEPGDRPKPAERRSDWVARTLSERITQHELQPGAKLPSENALATHFGVSRAVIREAIAMLKAEGLVETLQGSGAFVRAPEKVREASLDKLTHASVRSLLDLIEVRRVIEMEIAAAAAASCNRAQLEAIDAALDKLLRAEAEGRPGVEEDRAFHATIADATGNAYWRRLTSSLAEPIGIAIGVTRHNESLRRDFAANVAREHTELRDAIASGDPERARNAAKRHLEQAADRVLSADRDFWQKGGARVVNLPGED